MEIMHARLLVGTGKYAKCIFLVYISKTAYLRLLHLSYAILGVFFTAYVHISAFFK